MSRTLLGYALPPAPVRDHTSTEYNVPEPSEKDVMNRAYEIWERHGRPEGREDEFWALAQQELRNEDKLDARQQ